MGFALHDVDSSRIIDSGTKYSHQERGMNTVNTLAVLFSILSVCLSFFIMVRIALRHSKSGRPDNEVEVVIEQREIVIPSEASPTKRLLIEQNQPGFVDPQQKRPYINGAQNPAAQ